MATIAALIGGQIVSGIGNSIADGYREITRRNEWNRMMDFNQDRFDFQKDFSNRQLQQQYDLGMRGQNLSAGLGMMQVGGSLIGNLLSYTHAQSALNFQKDLNQQRRDDLTREGLPLSYLHLGQGLSRSIGGNIPMQTTQTFGRSQSNPWGFANTGSQNLRDTYGPPPAYSSGPRPPAATSRHLAASMPREEQATSSMIPGVSEKMDAGGYLRI